MTRARSPRPLPKRPTKPVKPEDFRNPDRPSGFDHVTVDHGGNHRPKPYRAQVYGGALTEAGHASLVRTRRATGEEAIQDYCDQINGSAIEAPPTFPAPPVDLGVTKHRERAPKQSTGKAFVDSKHDLYDVDLFDPLTGAFIRRKVGITATGDSRYQGTAATFGLGFRYRQKGVTYSNKAAALEAEDRLIASIRKDPSWQQVAKECFAKAVSE